MKPPDPAGVMRAIAILGEVAPILTPAVGTFDLASDRPAVEAVVEILRRHPMREEELIAALKRSGGEVQEALAVLATNGKARQHNYRGQIFWEYADSRFGRSTIGKNRIVRSAHARCGHGAERRAEP